ncbi:hypothetical protein [Streptomyces sp. NPDC058739]|uniref:hypothetical protein n=1 Tax=Streptomyces sp. NPDC058739 TaxID=3346618 RepID=UPI003696D7CE
MARWELTGAIPARADEMDAAGTPQQSGPVGQGQRGVLVQRDPVQHQAVGDGCD